MRAPGQGRHLLPCHRLPQPDARLQAS
jgi:hypothetical protein